MTYGALLGSVTDLGASWGPECLGGLSMSGVNAEPKQVIASFVLLRPPMFLAVTHFRNHLRLRASDIGTADVG